MSALRQGSSIKKKKIEINSISNKKKRKIKDNNKDL